MAIVGAIAQLNRITLSLKSLARMNLQNKRQNYGNKRAAVKVTQFMDFAPMKETKFSKPPST